jgi:hypothetical protein
MRERDPRRRYTRKLKKPFYCVNHLKKGCGTMKGYSIVAALFFASTIHAYASEDVSEADETDEATEEETALDSFLGWWAENAEPAAQNDKDNNDGGGGGGRDNDSSGGH